MTDDDNREEIVELEPGPEVLNLRPEPGFTNPGSNRKLSDWVASKLQQSRDDE
jgi:hypothetical protein